MRHTEPDPVATSTFPEFDRPGPAHVSATRMSHRRGAISRAMSSTARNPAAVTLLSNPARSLVLPASRRPRERGTRYPRGDTMTWWKARGCTSFFRHWRSALRRVSAFRLSATEDGCRNSNKRCEPRA